MTETNYSGTQEFTEEDRSYAGSRFAEVRDTTFANPYQKVWGADGESPLPVYPVSLASVSRGILPFGQPSQFRQAVNRAVDSHADLRWGKDGKGFRRLLHPNGICLTGLWEISESNPYSGYFQIGSKALVVGRYSTCCSETRRGRVRSLALAGKLYPGTDPEHAERLRTAHFFVQQDFGGEHTRYLNDAELRNAPDTRAWRRGAGLPVLLLEGVLFVIADKKASMRQVYQIAELGKPVGEPTRAPEFMRLLVNAEQPRIEGDELDFRDELMAQIFDRGDRAPKRHLSFHIEVTDQGVTKGSPVFERRSFENWKRIGSLTFTNAVASYNGDYILHFNHPGWRNDRNDPATALRVNQRRVRWFR